MDLTQSLKSSTSSFRPVCIGTNTMYFNQFAVNGAKVMINARGQSLNTTETVITAEWKRSISRAQVTAFLSSSSWPAYTALSHSLLCFPVKASFRVPQTFWTMGKE